MKTADYIEAILFMRGEPVKVEELSKVLSLSSEETEIAVRELEDRLSQGGIRLMRTNDAVTLTTAPEAADLISSLVKEDITSEIGKAGMEVLTIILYASPVSRRQIDYIRGVNSSSTLKKLSMKGMVERKRSGSGLAFVYLPTADMMSFLGITKVEDMLNYQILRDRFMEILGSDSDS